MGKKVNPKILRMGITKTWASVWFESGEKYIKNVRAYLSGDNLFCITGYSGLDPELSNPYPTYAGIDNRDKYPSIRSFTFGLQISF